MKLANPPLALAVLAFLLLPCAGVTRAVTPAAWSFEVVEISRVDRDRL